MNDGCSARTRRTPAYGAPGEGSVRRRRPHGDVSYPDFYPGCTGCEGVAGTPHSSYSVANCDKYCDVNHAVVELQSRRCHVTHV
eukprot:1348757-Amphidinium_carterae.2